MVAYTKDEEDYLFDIWKSVRKQDGDKGILNSSSNRQRYLKIYEAYRNQGYSRTYAQVETKLKKHRSSFIKVNIKIYISFELYYIFFFKNKI